MRIESISEKADRAGMYRVKLDNGGTLRLYRQTIEDFGLFPGLELTGEKLDRLQDEAGEMSAKMRAVRIISASSISKKELQRRLEHKGENAEQAKQAVEWLSEMNLLDDEKTAQQIVERCISRGYGINRARQALYEKKIPKKYWDSVLEDYPDQQEKIIAFFRSRVSDPSNEKERKKAIDALMRRGYQWEEVRNALSRLQIDECEED